MNNLMNEAIRKIHEEIDFYGGSYKNIDLDIYEKEWEIFFTTIYAYLEEKKMEEQFFDILMAIIVDTFACSQYLASIEKHNSIFHRKKYYITLYNLMESLRMLSLYCFNKLEVKKIRHEIMEKCSWGDVIDIKEYQKKKHLMKD